LDKRITLIIFAILAVGPFVPVIPTTEVSYFEAEDGVLYEVLGHTLEEKHRTTSNTYTEDSNVGQALRYYTDGENHEHSIVLRYPRNRQEEPLPVIVYFHGGGYVSGGNLQRDNLYFAERGYLTANVNYSLSFESKYPTQIEEATAAIIWLKENHEELKLDSNRIGVWGTSAGGHLAALLGVTSNVHEFEVMTNSSYTSEVQAVIDLYGAVNFTSMGAKDKVYDGTIDGSSRVTYLVGGPLEAHMDLVESANPINHITTDDPPYLMIHGTRDALIDYNQSQILYDAFESEGLDATLLTVYNAGHGFKPTLNYPSDEVQTRQKWRPKTNTVLNVMEIFFNKHLRGIEPKSYAESSITVENIGDENTEMKITHQVFGNGVNSTQSDIVSLGAGETIISKKEFFNIFGNDVTCTYLIDPPLPEPEAIERTVYRSLIQIFFS